MLPQNPTASSSFARCAPLLALHEGMPAFHYTQSCFTHHPPFAPSAPCLSHLPHLAQRTIRLSKCFSKTSLFKWTVNCFLQRAAGFIWGHPLPAARPRRWPAPSLAPGRRHRWLPALCACYVSSQQRATYTWLWVWRPAPSMAPGRSHRWLPVLYACYVSSQLGATYTWLWDWRPAPSMAPGCSHRWLPVLYACYVSSQLGATYTWLWVWRPAPSMAPGRSHRWLPVLCASYILS